MRFYFHLHNDVHTVDEEGREMPDAGTAFAEARDEARAMAAESVRLGSLDLSHHVAVSDESRFIATSDETLKFDSDAGVAQRLADLATERGADTIVVGYPIRMDGSVGPRAMRSRDLAVALEDASLCRVVLWDERLSSSEAERIMREGGERSRGRKGRVDQIAAAVILQGYLDSAGRKTIE